METEELKNLDRQQKTILKRIEEINIIDTGTLQGAVEVIKELKKARDEVKKVREFFVKPLQKQVKEINDKFKPYTDALDNAESEIKGKILFYEQGEERKRQEELEKLREKQQEEYQKEIKKAEKKGQIPPPPPAPIEIVKPRIEGLAMRKIWDFEVVDENKIPQEYLIPDAVKIRKVIQAGVRNIEGLRIFEKEIVAVSKDELQL
jgi:Asp-tRNA(Asn)/Glu-tRNA(Gln) amidotransferase C subunit